MLAKFFNHISHYAYWAKIMTAPVDRERLNDFYKKQKIFFIVSTGRTGTKWLANLLGKDPDALVEHEPVPMEAVAYLNAIRSDKLAQSYINRFKKKDIYLRIMKNKPGALVYGEVNGHLRRYVSCIKNSIKTAAIIHLYRNGRDIIKSVMERNTFSSPASVFFRFRPPLSDEYSKNWDKLDQFQKLCWLWSRGKNFMLKHCSVQAQFEKIIASYVYFKDIILRNTEINISEEIWNRSIKQPLKSTLNRNKKSSREWTAGQNSSFRRICGTQMIKLGYEL